MVKQPTGVQISTNIFSCSIYSFVSDALLNQQLESADFHPFLCHLCKNERVFFYIFNLGGQYIIVSLCGTFELFQCQCCYIVL